MGYIGDTGVELTSTEVAMITALNALAISSATQAIQKTGASSFANVELNVNGAIWGQLTGTLSNQTDLQTALDAKFTTANAAALTKTDDTNITLTLGGSPTTALLAATSLTLGWTGTLAVSRGGTGLSTFGGTNTILYTTTANNLSSIATANSGVLVTSGAGVPSIATDIPTAVTIGGAYIYRAGGTDIALADGGTNASLVASNGGIVYSTGTAMDILAGTATAGLALVSGASTTPSWFTPTAGSVLFAGVGGILQQDNANLFYDDTNNFLGLGIAVPTARLHLAGNQSASAWTTNGIAFRSAAATYTDTSTAGSGTVALSGINVFNRPTIAATNTLITYTDPATVYIAAGPIAGTNVTITNSWALIVDSAPILLPAANATMDMIHFRSRRLAIVSGDFIGGQAYTSNDTNLTSPGTNVGYHRMVANETHTASTLGTDHVFGVTKTLTMFEGMRLRGITTTVAGLGINIAAPLAQLHLGAGSATAGTAPIVMTSGPVLTAAVAGTHEFLTDDFFLTITTGTARKAIILDDGARLTSGSIPVATTNGRLIDSAFTSTNLTQGTWSPTITNDTNAGAATTITGAMYIRVGSKVYFSFRFTADPLLTATQTRFDVSLPVASAFANVQEANGTAFCGAIAGQGAAIEAEPGADTLRVVWIAGDINSQSWSAHGSYQII